MTKTMIWAGLAGAVALAGAAIAQDYNNTAEQPAPSATPSADTSATDTAATDDTAVNMAGERG